MLPILLLFADEKEHSYKEIPAHLETACNVLEVDKPNRARIMINNAIGMFKKAIVLQETGKQTWKMTARGFELLKRNPKVITVQDLRQFEEFEEFIQSRYRKVPKSVPSDNAENFVPEDVMDSAYHIHKANLADDLLDRVKQGTWQFFEMLVKDLLVKMGYGDPHDESQLAKGPADEGIDGVIKEDRLGLDIICVQAKKWDNPVGRPEVQKFAGSLESRHAKKGVFITTSKFTNEAQGYVQRIEKKIILIDGKRLCELMVDYDIGVSTVRSYSLKQIDNDYFITI